MFNEKDILARLQNGEDAQKIADEMAAILNAANKTYTDQKEAEKKAAAAKKAAAQKAKKEEADAIAASINHWIKKHYGSNLSVATGEMLIEIVDSTVKAVKTFENIESVFDVKPTGKKSVDTTIADFLEDMGW